MTDQAPTNHGWRIMFGLGGVLMLVGAGWWLWLVGSTNSSTSAASATRSEAASSTSGATTSPSIDVSPPPSDPASGDRAAPLLIETDLGTGSVEFSAVTRNGDNNRLIVADDEGKLYEFDIDEAGEPLVPARRVIDVQVGGGDIEGVAWMTGTTYVLAHENDGRLTVVDIDDAATSIGADQLVRTIDTGIREDDGSGLEGVAYVRGDPAIEFAVVDERPPTLYLIDHEGQVTALLVDLDVPDLSDIWADEETLYILSDEGRVVVEVRLPAPGESATELRRITLDFGFDGGRFEQPEGLVGDGSGGLYVVGEKPGPGRYSFGRLFME